MTSILEALTAMPQTKKVLAEKMGWSTRDVELEVQRYRVAGIPIVSNGDGYWLAQTPEEVIDCYRWLRGKYLAQARTAWSLKRAAARMKREAVQEELWAA